MIVAPNAELDRLRAENRELREELAEWKRHVAEGLTDDEIDRVSATCRTLRITALQARVLLLLMRRPGHTFSKAALLAIRPAHLKQDVTDKLSDALICHLRNRLRPLGFGGAIRTEWGRGYALDPAEAVRLARFLAGERQ